jgi:hypothetical protein
MSSKISKNQKASGAECAPKVETKMTPRTRLPLSDGSHARLTKKALEILAEDYGVTTGRLKKGSGSDVVVVSPTRFDGKPVHGAPEVSLRDLLAVHVYGLGTFREWENKEIEGYKLADGDARNLRPENFIKVVKTVKEMKERKPYTRKTPAAPGATRPAEYLSITEQEELLGEVFGKMRALAYAILTPDRYSKTGSSSQADEVVQESAMNILSLVRGGKCRAINRGMFFAFCFSLTQRAASWKLQAIASGFCRDVDHDEAEILLLRVKRLEADLRERRGQYAEEDSNSPLEGVDPIWLAKELERDAEEKAAEERQQMKEEGGSFDAVDLEAGTELSDDLLEDVADVQTEEAAA